MGASQRRKGASYEREVSKQINAALGLKGIGRKLGQARDGGNDIDFGIFGVECKRRKTLGTVYGWLQQCIEAVTGRKRTVLVMEEPMPGVRTAMQYDIDMTPIVIGREDNGVSLVILRLNDFLHLVRQMKDAGLIHFTREEIEGDDAGTEATPD